MPIGQLTKQFSPSMPGADLFARVAKLNRHYVTVGENAEKLVLYGRDVMGESILECSRELDENDIVILLNHRGEAIGVGRTRFPGMSLLTRGKITITTLLDAGMYLRNEG
jgi:60S ribosome subunit biogenesis protein NIP7